MSRHQSVNSQTQQDHSYRMALNQYLQYWRRQDDLYWSEAQHGARERTLWTVTCYLANVAYGTGHASTKGQAKERAAQQTLAMLNYQQSAAWNMGCSTTWHHHHLHIFTIIINNDISNIITISSNDKQQ
ncbi:hypothetical protein FRC19_009604 [Serendipita sp. 401]|nr:hypothetical protein FRC19_009604 [Serendipita sp. 401]